MTNGRTAAAPPPPGRPRLCIVGSGWRFTSGISYYTCLLANALAEEQHQVSVIPMRQLLPRRLYPGWRRVGQPRAQVTYRPGVRVSAGVNWWWGRSMARALRFLAAGRPDVIVLEWWTAAVLHSYLLLAVAGRLAGARLVLEVHELQDTGEGRIAPVRRYGQWGLRLLLALCHGCVRAFRGGPGRIAGPASGARHPGGDRAARPVRPVPAGRRPPRGPGSGPSRRPARGGQPAVLRHHPALQGTGGPAAGLQRAGRGRGGRPAADGDRRDLGRLHGARPSHRGQPVPGPDHLRERLCPRRRRGRRVQPRRRRRAAVPPFVQQRPAARGDELGPAGRGQPGRRPARGGGRLRGRGVHRARRHRCSAIRDPPGRRAGGPPVH